MAELHETRMGRTLIENTFPKIAKQLERIADSLELRNLTDAIASKTKQEKEENKTDTEHECCSCCGINKNIIREGG